MKPSAWLINVARGPIVDEAALIDALRARRIGGAILDVFDTEPLPPEHPLWTLDNETVTRLVDQGGIVAPTGKPGSVLMFHGNLVHASAPNITPYPRRIVYLTLCAVSNYIRKPTRPGWIAHRDFTPIVPVADDGLLNYARIAARRVAAE